MNKYANFHGLKPSLVYVDPPQEKVSEVKVDERERLLNFIYSENPITHHPQGDIAIFLSEKANPEVKAFIQQNLMTDNVTEETLLTADESLVNRMKAVITDDDIARFSRNIGESREEYAYRIRQFMDDVKSENSRRAEFNRIKKLLHTDSDA